MHDKSREATLGLAIVLCAFLAYFPSLSGGYVFDDHWLIQDSGLLRGPLWRIWLTGDAPDYWPLTFSSFWVENRLWGATPAASHAVNIALHAAGAVFLWRALARLRIREAWLAAVLFALHPVATESVAWLSERKNVLSGALFFATLLSWVRFRDLASRGAYALALLLYCLALLSKTSVVGLPFVLIAIDILGRGRPPRQALTAAAPFFVAALALGLLTVHFQTSHAMGGGWTGPSLIERTARSAWASATYLQQAFVPIGLAFVYPPVPPLDTAHFWVPIALASIALLAVVLVRRGLAKPLALAVGYHALFVLPVVGLIDIAYFAYTPIANHLQYIALAGPATFVATAAGRLLHLWPRRALGPVLALVAWFGLSSVSRSAAFSDDLALWSTAVRDAPQSMRAAWNLAVWLGDLGRVGEARQVLVDARARLEAPSERLRAEALLRLVSRQPTEALATATEALQLRYDPFFPLEFGTLLAAQDHQAQAAALLRPELDRHPNNSEICYRLGLALGRVGELEESVAVLRRGCRLSPAGSKNCPGLAFMLARAGWGDKARVELADAMGVSAADPAVDRALASAGL